MEGRACRRCVPVTPDELESLRRALVPLFLEKRVIKAVLFGSSASGRTTRRSDIDLVIVKETEKRFFDRYEEFSGLDDLFPGRAVDLLIYTPAELEKISHRPFIRRILEQGKVLYES
jgi:predicted nucleotidyltransferase